MKETYKVTAKKGAEPFVKVTAGQHSIIIDEPKDHGGTDCGMNPVQLLLSSVASCMTLTISIYAEAMGVEVSDLQVNVEGDMDSAGMKGSARVRPGFNKIRVFVDAKTNVPEETFQQVVDLAVLRCPVEDSVSKGVEFDDPVLTVHAD